MASYNLPVFFTVILIVPMLYFGIASLTFFLRPFEDPIVTRMLRGLFATYFAAVAACCALGAAVFAAYGRPFVALGLAAVAACASVARGWYLRRMDVQIRARDGGDGRATRRLRRLHVEGIAYNLVQLAVVIGMVPARALAAAA